jgi:acyl-coenzyme A thioesterase PaaI-like protein
MASTMVVENIPTLYWPENDTLVDTFIKEHGDSHERHSSPMLAPTLSDGSMLAVENGRSYTRVFPKYLVVAFRPKKQKSLRRTTGFVYFSSSCLGAPGLAHGGALSTCADVLAGDLAISSTYGTKLYYTRTLATKFIRFVRLETVVRFECSFVANPGKFPGSKEGDIFISVKLVDASDAERVLVDCVANMVHAAGLTGFGDYQKQMMDLERPAWRRGWDMQHRTMHVPNSLSGWWPVAAQRVCKKLLEIAPSPMNLVDIGTDFPGLKSSSAKMESLYGNPPNQRFWDFSPLTTPYISFLDQSLLPQLKAFPPKIRRQTYWRQCTRAGGNRAPALEHRILAGCYIFSSYSQGPPGRTHGGAIASSFDDAMGALVVRERGFFPAHNTTELIVRYKSATLLSEPMIMVARMLPGMEERECASEAILLSPEVFFQLNHPFSDVWNFKRSKIKVNAYSFARWKRPKASTLGLQKLLDYDEMYNRQNDETNKEQPTAVHRQWAKM